MSGSPSAARRLLAPVVVGAMLVASVIAAALVWSAERGDAERANQALARQAAAVAERQVELTGASLRGGEGVLRRSGPDARARVSPVRPRRSSPRRQFPSLVWAPRVPARERARFERTLNRRITRPRPPTEGQPKGDLRPVERRKRRLSADPLRPPRRATGQGASSGLDLLSEPDPGGGRARGARRQRDHDHDPGRALRGRTEHLRASSSTPSTRPGHGSSNARQRQLALAGVLSGGDPDRGRSRRRSTEQLGAAASTSRSPTARRR